MLKPGRRSFDAEKQQLQELNVRLGQYLTRTQQLEQENARLMAQIGALRRDSTTPLESGHKAELRELRRTLEQLHADKSRAEMDRDRLWRELQTVQGAWSEQSEVCRDMSGEVRGLEQEMLRVQRTNAELQQRLLRLRGEYRALEEAHTQEMEQGRRQLEVKVPLVVAQSYCGPRGASGQEVQEFARGVSEAWVETLELYQRKVEEMEQVLDADQAAMTDLQREKMLYAAELEHMRTEADQQGRVQLGLEEQLMVMQDQFHQGVSEYQRIIEQLQQERNIMADTISQKVREHQQLLQVKMDLSAEVATYRSLLQGEQASLHDPQRRANQHQRERRIDIKLPAQPSTTRSSILSSRQHTNVRLLPPTAGLTRSPVRPSGSRSPSGIVPITAANRHRYQSPESRRDMISFTKARAGASAPATVTTSAAADAKATPTGRRETNGNQSVQRPPVILQQAPNKEKQTSPVKSFPAEAKSVREVSPGMTLSMKTETENQRSLLNGNVCGSQVKEEEPVKGSNEKKSFDSVSVEEIIERAIKPAGLEDQECSSGESKIRYHVQTVQQEDGTTKTQIVLESKVEEEVDISEDFCLEELLSQGAKKVSLEDIKDTATGGMIKNLLSDLQGAQSLQNKSINVEIIEEPVEPLSDDEAVEQMSRASHEPSSTCFQIEELEDVPCHSESRQSFMTDSSKSESLHVEDVSGESESPHFSLNQEPDEYFVSTPDEDLSETEDGGGITSCGLYGMVHDLSDERYYQDENLPAERTTTDDYKFIAGLKESFPECIIEEEVCVSPVVQESVLEFLREDSLEPKEQLKGALEQLQSSVSGPLKEELAFLTKMSTECPENVAVNFKTTRQSSDDGTTTTIVAELNVSQTLEDSDLLEGDSLSEDQIMAALRSSNLGIDDAFSDLAGGGYKFSFTKDEDFDYGGGFEASPEHPSDSKTPGKVQEKKVAMIYLENPED